MRLNDVAEHAGVSTAVVSYVINDGPRPVAATTRARVLASIQELGYRPNRVAQALASQKSGTIGLVVPDTTNAFFSDLVHAVESAAFQAGLLTMIGNCDLDLRHEEAYLEALIDAKVDGLIIATTDLDAPPGIDETGTKLVYIHRRSRDSSIPLIRADDRAAARKATEFLLDLGYPTVHCLAGPERWGPIEARVESWRATLEDRNAPIPELVGRAEHRRGVAATAVMSFLEQLTEPTALFTSTDEQALGVLSAAWRLGVRVPEDLAVIACDGTSAAATSVPPLTTVALPITAMGAAAVNIIRGSDPAGLDLEGRLDFDTVVVERDSTPPKR